MKYKNDSYDHVLIMILKNIHNNVNCLTVFHDDYNINYSNQQL